MVWYNNGKGLMLDPNLSPVGEGPLLLLSDRIIIALMKAAYAVDIDAHHDFADTGVSTNEIVCTGYTARGDNNPLAGKTVTVDDANDRAEFDANDLVYTALGNGTNDTFDEIIIMREQDAGATDANTMLLAHASVSSTTTNGGNITLVFNAEGILQLS